MLVIICEYVCIWPNILKVIFDFAWVIRVRVNLQVVLYCTVLGCMILCFYAFIERVFSLSCHAYPMYVLLLCLVIGCSTVHKALASIFHMCLQNRLTLWPIVQSSVNVHIATVFYKIMGHSLFGTYTNMFRKQWLDRMCIMTCQLFIGWKIVDCDVSCFIGWMRMHICTKYIQVKVEKSQNRINQITRRRRHVTCFCDYQ